MSNWAESVLPIATIRNHAKINDIKTVDDSQLELYRAAAFEQAEFYTGFSMKSVRQVVQNVKVHEGDVSLDWPARDTVYWASDHQNGMVQVNKFDRTVTIKSHTSELYCGGFSGEPYQIQYDTGFSCADEIPPSILLGCLKLIAWNVKNPGDQLITMRAGKTQSSAGGSSGIAGTNDGVFASGAQELWAKYQRMAFST